MASSVQIVPREHLDFDLQGDIARFWLGGDPFKTRFFDAMSVIFPEGERYFISCVRDFRDAVTEPQLLQQIKDFTRQEGQHAIVHREFNQRLKAQGVDVDWLEGMMRSFLFDFMRRFLPKKYNLASTAACEHLTAIMAQAFFAARPHQDKKRSKSRALGPFAFLRSNGTWAVADPRIYSMYAWHAVEEMEHKAVAFDVLQKVAKGGYWLRVFALFEVTLSLNLHILLYALYMLKVDGFSRRERLRMFATGLWWVYGPRGIFTRNLRAYLRYCQPSFHPWNVAQPPWYGLWLETFKRTRDPVAAGRAVFELRNAAYSVVGYG